MKIRRIKQGAVIKCPWCKAMGNGPVIAKWHLTGANKQACDAHKHHLEDIRDGERASANHDPSEADYQTWMRL